MLHRNLDSEKARTLLFSYLKTVLRVSEKKFLREQKKDYSRLKWGRLLVQGVQAYGKLLETVQLDELMREIDAIKQHLGMK